MQSKIEERTPAIVLRGRVYGESDKIVTFLTRDWGKVTGIAKGAKRSRRRFVNVLEPFTHVELRFRPSRGEDLAFIFGCELLQNFRGPSRDLQRFAVASYTVELIDVMVTGQESGQDTYRLLLDNMTILEQEGNLSPLLLPMFEFLLLTYSGYAPQLQNCQQCSASLSTVETTVLCSRCRERGGTTLLISTEPLHLLRKPKEADLKAHLATAISPRAIRETRMLVSSFLSRHLPRPLKSRAFLEQAQLAAEASVDASEGE
jgi:DNA repair protein RecO (recombination protein O)